MDKGKWNEEYSSWASYANMPDELADELAAISQDDKEIEDCFYRHLEFGTGGLRGVIGAGTNRINIFTVTRATKGLADYLRHTGGNSVCIAYDTRNKSREFAEIAAGVLAAAGIQVYFFEKVKPTPMLSFAVRYKKASAGIVITASHNPPEFNGYKVYNSDGCQITDQAASDILSFINTHEALEPLTILSLKEAADQNLLEYIDDIDSDYYKKVVELTIRKEMISQHASELRVLYTPLHGTGYIPIETVLLKMGFTGLEIVDEQSNPDGNFSTVGTPNPEESSVFDLAKKRASKSKFDLILATDPDCDRVGVLVLDKIGKYQALNGNEIGILLSEYLISAYKEFNTLGENPAIIKTIVTTELIKKIAEKNDVTVSETLTGFKYIGEKIGEWEQTKQNSFLFGFEESYGYLAGDFVRDKDAVIAVTLIAEMSLYYKMQQKTLIDALFEINDIYGYSNEILISKSIKGQDGEKKIAQLMSNLRSNHKDIFRKEEIWRYSDYSVSQVIDYKTNITESINLPKSNVLKIEFADESWIAIRPSGTESKIKFYIGSTGDSKISATTNVEVLSKKIELIL